MIIDLKQIGLSFLAQVIRHCGAFFIRRSFGSDKLYWALFNEYVQQHLLNCDRPLEFFIEGTRSRTSKSLPPKHGKLFQQQRKKTQNLVIDDTQIQLRHVSVVSRVVSQGASSIWYLPNTNKFNLWASAWRDPVLDRATWNSQAQRVCQRFG